MYLGRGLRTAIFGGRGTAVFPSHPSTLPPRSIASQRRPRSPQTSLGTPVRSTPKTWRRTSDAQTRAHFRPNPPHPRTRPLPFVFWRPRPNPNPSPGRAHKKAPPDSKHLHHPPPGCAAPHRTEIASRTGGGRGKGDRWVWGRERERERGRDSYREIHLLSSLPVTLVCRRRRRPLPRARVGRGVVRGVAPPSPLKP